MRSHRATITVIGLIVTLAAGCSGGGPPKSSNNTGPAFVTSAVPAATKIALVQLLAVVAGHVFGVVAAHDRAVRLFHRTHAIAGQLPMLVLMVGYTIGGLLLLLSP